MRQSLPPRTLWWRTKRSLPKYLLLLVVTIACPVLVYSFLYSPQTPFGTKPTYGVSFDPYYARSLGLDWHQTYLDLLDSLGVKYIRLSAPWNVIEQRPGEYFWGDLDWLMDEAKKRDVQVILSIGRKLPRWPECHDPSWLKNLSAPEVEKELLEMLKAVVTRYRDYPNLEIWQVENEPFFPFGNCQLASPALVKKEIDVVRSLDDRLLYTTDSGEGGTWFVAGQLGDLFGISMYRIVWFDFWGLLPPVYFKYPLPHWSYRLKSFLTGLPLDKIFLVELQGEPWGEKPNDQLTEEEEAQTMNQEKFNQIIDYSQKAGFKRIYLWGAEWWEYKRVKKGNSWYWDRAKELF